MLTGDHRSVLLVPRVWRADIPRLILFFLGCIASIALSYRYPSSVVYGHLFRVGGLSLTLGLPLFWLLPAGILCSSLFYIYDVRYLLDRNGIEARVGRLRLNQRIMRINFEDIRSIETAQSIIGRILDVGRLEIGTAATGAVEVVFDGIGSPKQLQLLIQAERDRRANAKKPRVTTADETSPPAEPPPAAAASGA